MKKRIFSFLMAACMVVSNLPVPAHAEETPAYYCGKEEHSHLDSCYSPVLICEAAEHQHGETCYEGQQTLTCTLPEAHDHGDECKDAGGNVACGKTLAHVHSEACTIEGEAYTCGYAEAHTHEDGCYTSSQNLICQTKEHTHDVVQCYTAETVETTCTLEAHTHEESCLVDPNATAPAHEEEPQEETPTCTCDTACTAEAMNGECAVCGAEGATVEGCGKYVAPAVCTCEAACAAGAMNTACAICGADDAKLENCTKYQAPASYTVTFNVGEHGTAPEIQTITSGGTVEKPADPTAEGFTFGGWYVDEAYTTAYDFSAAVTANTTLYAKWTADTSDNGSNGTYEIDTAEKLLQFGSGESGINAVLTADITFPTGNTLTISEGATLTVPDGKTLSVPGDIVNNGTFILNGTLVLSATMYKGAVMGLGITGTGGIKFGAAHIDTAGNCITHSWFERIYQKDTTNHYTKRCNICGNGDEETIEPCVYDNDCDTDCNICGIVRTITHQYDENGFCTVCRYSDSAAEDSDGDGYVEIDTAGKLWWFTHEVNGGNRSLNAELTANIDLSGTCGDGIGNWLPISHEDGYAGNFNGQGHTISNLYMSGDDQYIGLFGYVKGATIENVSVTGIVSSTFSSFIDLDNYVYLDGAAGGIVAFMRNGTIRNCHVDMTVSGGFNIGGICGTMYDGRIEGCTVNGNVICNALPDQGSGFDIGGIVGCQYEGTVRGCVNRANASAENSVYFGGIAGLATGDAIENCLNYGTFTAIYDTDYFAGTTAGGIVGTSGTVIRGCGNLGSINISGTGKWTGGIAGLHQSSRSIVENCYNVGSITSSDGKFGVIVGVVGADATATNNYYLSDTETADGGRTAAQFASGQVAFELNGSTTTDTSVWRQTLGTDSYPTLSGKLVYSNNYSYCDNTAVSEYGNTQIDADVVHRSEEHKLVANNNGTHNEVWSCCEAVVTENIACTAQNPDADCTTEEKCACGYLIKAAQSSHDFSGTYLSDEEGHWHKCVNCDVTDPKVEHSGTDDNNCTTAVTCSACGYTMTAAKDHTGTNDKLVSKDVIHHNVVWSCCNAVVTENVDCTASNADGSCLTAETCACGNMLIHAKDSHKLTYTASGNVITETCGWQGCEHTATATLHAPENPVYDGTQKLATVTHSEGWAGYRFDAISYSGTANDGSSYAGIAYPAVKAGTVTASIFAQNADDTLATASVEYTIEKATPNVGAVSVESPAAIYPSTALNTIALARTNTTVPGTLALDAGQTLTVGTKEYNWTFTPDEPHNYNGVTGKVSITVVEDTLQSIAVTTPPYTTTYEYGMLFYMDGIVVTATYASGKTEVIDNDDLTITPRQLTVTDTYVTITYQGLTTTQEITVNPREVSNPWIWLAFDSYPYTGQEIYPDFRVCENRTGDIVIPASEYKVEITDNIQPGTATITISDVPGGNYDVSGSTTFEIIPAEIRDVSVSQTGTLTYTGSALTPTANASATTVDGAAVTFTYCATQDGTYSAELPAFTNAGTHTVWFKANAEKHAEYSGSFEVVIGKADPTADYFTFTAPIGLTCTGSALTVTVTDLFALKAPFSGEVELSPYYRKDGVAVMEIKDAGTYTVLLYVEGDNFNFTNTPLEDSSWTFEVTKSLLTIDASQINPTLEYGMNRGTMPVPAEAVTGWKGAPGTVNIQYEIDYSESNAGDTTFTNVTYTLSPGELDDIYTIVVTNNGNNGSDEISGTVTPRPIRVVWPEETQLQYDGQEQTITATLWTGSGGLMQDQLPGQFIVTVEKATTGGDYTNVTGAPIQWKATGITLAPDVTNPNVKAENYTIHPDWETSGEYVITTLPLTVTATGTLTKEYDGTTAVKDTSGVTLTATPVNDSGSTLPDNLLDGITLSFDPASSSYADKNVGSSKSVTLGGITIQGSGAGNFTLTSSQLTAAIGEITPKVVGSSAIELEYTTHVYTGGALEPTVTVKDSDVVIPASEYKVAYSDNTDVGTATVTITDVTGGTYTVSGSATFEITLAEIMEVSVSQNGTLTYTGEAQTPSVNATATTVDNTAVTFTYCATEDGTYTAELPAFTNAGTYTVYFKANAANHEESSGSFEIVVGKATNEWTTEPSITGWTYGEFGNDPTAKAKFGDEIMFAYRAVGATNWWENPPTEAGSYEMRARVQASDNWVLLETIVPYTIAKADPTADIFDFTPPANLNACDGLAKEATVTVKEGIEGVGSITITYFKDGNPLTGAPTTVGTYTVQIEVAEGANFFAADDLTVGTFTFDITDAADHANVAFVAHNDGTHDKICTVCQQVIESSTPCSGTTTDDCTKGYKCACGNYFGTKEHDFSGDYLTDADGHWHKCADCGATDTKVEHSATEDGDCTTEESCSCGTVVIVAKDDHSFDNACDTTCNNEGCKHTRFIVHEPTPDDGDCTTVIRCAICNEITTEAKEHSFDNSCDTTCNNKDCKHTRTITHTPDEDDDDCSTAIHCSICDTITTQSKSHDFTNACDTTCNNEGCKHTRFIVHEPTPDDADCTTVIRCAICNEITTEAKEHSFDDSCDTTCNNKGCKYTRTITHTPSEDDGSCLTAVHCSVCDAITTPAKSHSFTNACDTSCNNTGCTHTRMIEHTPEDDDGDCTTDILCSVCDAVTTKGNEAHTGGTATCTAKAECSVCGTKYGEMLKHTYTIPQSDEADHWNKCKDCDAIDLKIKHSGDDDGDCTTEVKCSCGWVLIVAKSHSFDNACDTDCNNVGCEYTRTIEHTPEEDDGSCLTEIRCIICNVITTEARDAHTGGTATCTAKAKCAVCGTEYGEMLEHAFTVPQNDSTHHWNKCKDCDAIDTKVKHSGTDDGDCTTELKCSCGYVITKATAGHTGGKATCTAKAKCAVCGTAYGDMLEHSFTVPQSDDADHWNKCKDCDAIDTKVKHSCTDDGDCTTELKCSCGYVITEAKTAHSGGTATCTAKAECAVCGTAYGDMLEHAFTVPQSDDTDHWNKCKDCDAIDTKVKHSGDDDGDCTTELKCSCGYIITNATAGHTGGAATCTGKARCQICGMEYGSLDTDNHDFATAWTQSEDTHYYKCIRCDAKKDEANHEYDNACDTTCNVCGKVRPITHTYAEAHDDAQHWQECSVCHNKKDAAAHSFYDDLDSSCNGCSFIRTVFYTVTKGNEQTVTKGNAASFTSNAPFNKFVKVQVDSVDVSWLKYTVDEGSTIVTLRASFINTLSVGQHTLRIVSEDGWAETTFKVKARPADSDSPATGDISQTGLWITLTGIGLLGLIASIASKMYYRKRR